MDPIVLEVLKIGGSVAAAGVAIIAWLRSEKRCDFLIGRLAEVQNARIAEAREGTTVFVQHTNALTALTRIIEERVERTVSETQRTQQMLEELLTQRGTRR